MTVGRVARTTLVALACASVLVCCHSSQGAEEPPPKPPVDKEEIVALMNQQLAALDRMHKAIAFGDLTSARESAAWLARHAMVANVPVSWDATVKEVRKGAEKVASQKKLSDIGESLGALAIACGSCHEMLGLEVVVASGTPMSSGTNPAMLRHSYAMNLLERGVALPSDDLWKRGIAELEAGSFDLEGDPPDPTDARDADAIAGELRELTKRAAAAKTVADRGAIYGAMMSRCTACHERTRQP